MPDLTPADAVAKLKRLLTRDSEDGYGNVVVKFAERQELHDALNLLLADHARLILACGEANKDRDTLAARVRAAEAENSEWLRAVRAFFDSAEDSPEERAALQVLNELRLGNSDAATPASMIEQLQVRLEAAETELAWIDERLSRRPALADCRTRAHKIDRLCGVAGRCEKAESELEDLRQSRSMNNPPQDEGDNGY